MIKYGDIEIWKCRICGVTVEASGSGMLDADIEKLASVDSTHVHDMYYSESKLRKADNEEDSSIRAD